MATTPEGKVKRDVKKFLIEIGAWFYMPVQNGMGVTGIPDFIVCINGRFVAIETKAPGKLSNLSANQQAQLASISRAGGATLVADSVDTVKVFFRMGGFY